MVTLLENSPSMLASILTGIYLLEEHLRITPLLSIKAISISFSSIIDNLSKLTILYSRRFILLNPRFGNLRWIGIWPPSNHKGILPPERDFCPLCPFPACFPRPEPSPLPNLFFPFLISGRLMLWSDIYISSLNLFVIYTFGSFCFLILFLFSRFRFFHTLFLFL